MTDEEMRFLKGLAMVVDAKVCTEFGNERGYSNIAINNQYLPLVQRALHFYISKHEKLRGNK